MNYTTPGVYVEEISLLPSSVAPVATAIPAFIGYTKEARDRQGATVTTFPHIQRIASVLDYEFYFGGAQPQPMSVALDTDNLPSAVAIDAPSRYRMPYAIEFYFRNGGGPCYIVSVGTYADLDNSETESVDRTELLAGLAAIRKVDEPTLLLFPDATSIDGASEALQRTAYHDVLQAALQQCADLGDRFLIADIFDGDSIDAADLDFFRTGIGNNHLKYGAAYHPWLRTDLQRFYRDRDVVFDPGGSTGLADITLEDIKVRLQTKELLRLAERSLDLANATTDPATAKAEAIRGAQAAVNALGLVTGAANTSAPPAGFAAAVNDNLSDAQGIDTGGADPVGDAQGFAQTAADQIDTLLGLIDNIPDDPTETTVLGIYTADFQTRLAGLLAEQVLDMPPSSAVAGVYAATDRARGVWKAPANVSLTGVTAPLVKITNAQQGEINVHPTGKSINAIRAFAGKGILIWGARTLAGNDNEWRYVPVRRFFNFVEESVKKASEPFVFEPNDANTWIKVRAMIENFLTLQWRAGALAGAKPEDAFFVKVGLGTSMTPIDVLEGRMNVEIGMAVVRPAEFIILKFSHKMQE
jgi:phage tail sheath protein FI